MKHIDKPFV